MVINNIKLVKSAVVIMEETSLITTIIFPEYLGIYKPLKY
jgi:hypothetical protein